MARLKTRVDAIERKARPQADGWLCVQQDLNDFALYHGQDGAGGTDAQLVELANTHTVVRLDWDSDWRAPHVNEKRVKLTWGDVQP